MAGLIVGFTLMGLTFGPMAAYLPELFPSNVRYTGSAIAYNMSSVTRCGPGFVRGHCPVAVRRTATPSGWASTCPRWRC